MRTILALIETPDDADRFVRYAVHLARDLETNVHLLHVVTPNEYPLGTMDMSAVAYDNMLQSHRVRAEKNLEILEKLASKFKEEESGKVGITCSTEIGYAQFTVEKYLEDGKMGMVLVEGGREQNFWSQNATNMDIIRKVEYPVWVVPHNAEYLPVKNIIYASDFKEEDVITLRQLILLFYAHKPEITALHVTDSVDFEHKVKETGFLDLVRNKTNYDRVNVKVLSENKGMDLGKMVNNYAIIANADMIAVLKENKSFIERLFSTSSTKKILDETQLPVLVFKEMQ